MPAAGSVWGRSQPMREGDAVVSKDGPEATQSDEQPGLKGHVHHWYSSDSNADTVWWSCAGCGGQKRTATAARHLNNAIDAPGGQQCQSKYNVVDPPATFCAEYPCERTARRAVTAQRRARLLGLLGLAWAVSIRLEGAVARRGDKALHSTGRPRAAVVHPLQIAALPCLALRAAYPPTQ